MNDSRRTQPELDQVPTRSEQDPDSRLIDLANEFADRHQGPTIVVTGASGFVGGRVCRSFANTSAQLIASGRNRYQNVFSQSNLRFVRADLSERRQVDRLIEGADFVIHCASLASPWGKREAFVRNNVLSTRNVAEACRNQQVRRLVHVSSTAIFFENRDRIDVGDQEPLANPFFNHYASSKAESEEVIDESVGNGLDAITIRARAVFGPGDQSLLPRLIEAGQNRKLKQIGDGSHLLDLTYVDNLVQALILAMDRGQSGAKMTITNDEPIRVWDLISRILVETNPDHDGKLSSVPKWLAQSVAGLIESAYRLRSSGNEPPMTRYAVGLLACNQTFNLSEAKKQLHFEPFVSMEQAIERTVMNLKSRSSSQGKASVELQWFSTGFTSVKERVVEKGGTGEVIRLHASVALIRHPEFGLTLFDTGYSPRFLEATERFPYSLYHKLTPVAIHSEWSIVTQLKQLGIQPNEIGKIIVSHFHGDHTCGLLDFPDADIIALDRAWRAMKNRSGIAAVRRAFLPQLVPASVQDRFHLLRSFQDPGIGPFERTHDLFGDGSVRFVELPGHAEGQLGALVSEASGQSLLVADSVWTSKTIERDLPFTWQFKQLAANRKDSEATRKKLVAFRHEFPGIKIVPTHCPQVAKLYKFDEQLNRLLQPGGIS